MQEEKRAAEEQRLAQEAANARRRAQLSKQGLVVFDVPRSHTYRLKVDGGFWSSESALIKLDSTSVR